MTKKDNSIINAKLLEVYNLQYLKENNDLITSVKKETEKQLSLCSVTQQRELLINFMCWFNEHINSDGILENEIDHFIEEKN